LAIVDTEVAKLLQPGDENIRLADLVQSTKTHRSITPPVLMILGRSLVLIFIRPKDSKLDSAHVKTRKKHTQARCETFRAQHPHIILVWAIALPASTWNTFGGMANDTFDFLIEKLKTGRINQLPPVILQKSAISGRRRTFEYV
jgi:hypothetical protein